MNDELKPEEKIEIQLWDWLKTKGEFVKEIYFNRKNKLNSPIFTTKGINKKPDFLIKIDRGYGIEFIAVEIKDNSKSSQVYDSNKIINYFESYRNKETLYFIDEKLININYFIIATQDSPNGHLFKMEKEVYLINNLTDSGNDTWKSTLAKYGFEPKNEWGATSQHQRNLFGEFRKLRKNKKITNAPGIGILISDINSNGNSLNIPYIFIMNYNSYNSNFKSKWGCRYWKI